MEITKIVITGGPCGGKSTALSWIQNAFTMMGYTVLFVPETATEFISGGVTPWTCKTNLEYQKLQMTLQLTKEELFLRGASGMNAEKILIVCDRGAMDNRAYMNEEEFEAVCAHVGKSEEELKNRYHAVFHLVTAAKGAEQFYTTANNAARYETAEEAAAIDDRFIKAWTGHPHLRVIGNATDFENKMKHLIAEIALFLGEPVPYDIKRKFLVAYPDVNWLSSIPGIRKINIVQTYLKAPEGDEIRIRQRTVNGVDSYYQTVRQRKENGERIEIEKRLTKGEYKNLLLEADPEKRVIRKTRWSLNGHHHYFEIDLYPFWKNTAIMQTETADDKEDPVFPEEVKVLREVTPDKRYRNAALSSLPDGELLEMDRQ